MRAAGASLLVVGAAIAALPALTWYRAPPAASPTEASGFAVAGQLWLLPLLGAVIALAGATLVAARAGQERAVARRAGPIAGVAAIASLILVAWAAIDRSARVTITAGGASESVTVPTELAPAAIAAPALTLLALTIAAGVAWAGSRR